ncbi:MAG: SHOCT domain-containing protein [Alphaproteobacteria bacterium]|nr:SHOCT domain-containing protein [Alphaproteobacteria bacterium]
MNWDALEKLHSLKEKGILSEAEFQQQKKKLLQQNEKPAQIPNTTQTSYPVGCLIALAVIGIIILFGFKFILALIYVAALSSDIGSY